MFDASFDNGNFDKKVGRGKKLSSCNNTSQVRKAKTFQATKHSFHLLPQQEIQLTILYKYNTRQYIYTQTKKSHNISAAKVWYAHYTIWILLFFPYPPGNSKLQLLPIPTGEEEGHASLDNETVMAVPNFPVTIPDTSRGAFPNKLPVAASNFKTVAVIVSAILISHKSKKRHVHRGRT